MGGIADRTMPSAGVGAATGAAKAKRTTGSPPVHDGVKTPYQRSSRRTAGMTDEILRPFGTKLARAETPVTVPQDRSRAPYLPKAGQGVQSA